jgi:hypothetical protein
VLIDLSRKRVLTGKALEEPDAVTDSGLVLHELPVGDKTGLEERFVCFAVVVITEVLKGG